MRSSSLARLVLTALGLSVVITPGCGGSSPSGPPPLPSFSVRSISPSSGSSHATTTASITGTGFQPGATVTVDGSRVDATVVSATTITLTMPAHAAGKVVVTVIGPFSQEISVPGGYTYVALPPPVITELLPNIGSTGGGTPMVIRTNGFGWPLTVTIDGTVSAFDAEWWDLYLSTPAHAAGTVDVMVTNPDGQSGTARFTYASPATFDFNGDWQGWAHDVAAPPGALEFARLLLTIRDNRVVSVSCSLCRPGENCGTASHPSQTLEPPAVVANGEFSLAGSGGVSITGKILSPNSAAGSISMASCGSRQWRAEKK